MTKRTFEIRAEAACCMWEALCEWRNLNAATGNVLAVQDAFKASGTVTMRHRAIALADLCCATFDAIGRDRVEELDLIPYDWEFCPAFLKALPVGVWSGDAAPDAKAMARAMIDAASDLPAIMAAAGFEVVETGGGCKAWSKALPGKGHVWITSDDGTGLGDSAAETFLVGLYRAESCEELSQTGSCDGAAAAIAEANRLLAAFDAFADVVEMNPRQRADYEAH